MSIYYIFALYFSVWLKYCILKKTFKRKIIKEKCPQQRPAFCVPLWNRLRISPNYLYHKSTLYSQIFCLSSIFFLNSKLPRKHTFGIGFLHICFISCQLTHFYSYHREAVQDYGWGCRG